MQRTWLEDLHDRLAVEQETPHESDLATASAFPDRTYLRYSLVESK